MRTLRELRAIAENDGRVQGITLAGVICIPIFVFLAFSIGPDIDVRWHPMVEYHVGDGRPAPEPWLKNSYVPAPEWNGTYACWYLGQRKLREGKLTGTNFWVYLDSGDRHPMQVDITDVATGEVHDVPINHPLNSVWINQYCADMGTVAQPGKALTVGASFQYKPGVWVLTQAFPDVHLRVPSSLR